MNKVSLRASLLLRLGALVLASLAVDAIACYFTALHFSNLVYDRWLVDSARSLSQAVKIADGQTRFDLPAIGLQVFQFDEIDQTYFRVRTASGATIAGNAGLPFEYPDNSSDLRLGDALMEGKPVRLVTTVINRQAAPADRVYVDVGETLNKRSRLKNEILLAMATPQIALVAMALLFSWLGVSRGLKPITDLAAQIESRDHDNLTPVSESGLPREVQVLAARINELLARLNHALVAQRRFVADAAHQLRTPLAAVALHAERALRASDPETGKDALRTLNISVERAARLSQQLVSLARTEPEAIAVSDFKSLDLNVVARRAGEEWIPQALKRNIDFGLAVSDHPIWIRGNSSLLAELLSNLIDNALRYGGAHGRVTVRVDDYHGPTLKVEDDGPGIPPPERAKVLQRFYRIPGSEGQGCGLGLAIVNDIAGLHNGRVQIDSLSRGKGTCIAVSFPAAAPLISIVDAEPEAASV